MVTSLFNSSGGYGWLSIILHWLSFALVVGLFAMGAYMVELTYYDKLYHILPEWHKAMGFLLALITVIRLIWLSISKPPVLLSQARLITFAVKSVHVLMYGILILLPVSGYLMTTAEGADIALFDLFSVPAIMVLQVEQAEQLGDLHRLLAYALIGTAAGHGAAALLHHFLLRDNTLKRMLKPL